MVSKRNERNPGRNGCYVSKLKMKEQFAIVGTFDVRYGELSRNERRHLFDDACFRFRKTEGIHQVRFLSVFRFYILH